MTKKDVAEALDREISYYRVQLKWVYHYTLALQLSAFAGDYLVPMCDLNSKRRIFAGFFALIALISSWLTRSYIKRVYKLRDERSRYIDIYPPPGGDGDAVSPSTIMIISFWVFSFIGIMITISR